MSGLKTAVLRYVKAERAAGRDIDVPDLAASFQEAIVDVQVTQDDRGGAAAPASSTVLLGGGRRREHPAARADGAPTGAAAGLEVLVPAARRCAPTTPRWSRAWAPPDWLAGERASLDIGADPNLGLAS